MGYQAKSIAEKGKGYTSYTYHLHDAKKPHCCFKREFIISMTQLHHTSCKSCSRNLKDLFISFQAQKIPPQRCPSAFGRATPSNERRTLGEPTVRPVRSRSGRRKRSFDPSADPIGGRSVRILEGPYAALRLVPSRLGGQGGGVGGHRVC